MRSASAGLLAFLASNNIGNRTDLYTLTLLDGTVYRWTSWENDLAVSGNTYLAAIAGAAPIVQRGAVQQTAGLQVDTLDVTLLGQGFSISGVPLGLKAAQGFFDGARLQVDHLIMQSPGDTSLLPVSSFFEGRVSTATPRGVNVELRVKSEIETLNVLLPKFLMQPACGNAVYDANCGLNRGTFTKSVTATGTPTTLIVTCSSATFSTAEKVASYFNLGVLKFTSGANSGLRQCVAAYSESAGVATFTLQLPFRYAPSAGDTFTVYPGCDRTKNTCLNKFNNLPQHRGFSHVPKTEAGS